jgi:hypothetical protein
MGLLCTAAGGALVGPPSSNAIMGSVPGRRAGMGSATNAAMRQIASSLGVAVIGGFAQIRYVNKLTDSGLLNGLSASATDAAKGSISGAIARGNASLTDAANQAFVSGMRFALIIATAVALVGAFIASRFIPVTQLDAGHLGTDIAVAAG